MPLYSVLTKPSIAISLAASAATKPRQALKEQQVMHWYLKVLKKYAVFSGRASRQEYWMFFLFNFIFAFVLELISGLLSSAVKTDQSVLSTIYQLAVFLPSLAV
ncbi:MAG TPA: DUF805 domain-containing protein, partial [Crinalium sp.]